jgi:hypothetical protein
MRWLSEPVQGEPLRVTAERRLVPGGEPVRLDALLQDAQFHAVSGAEVRGEITGPGGALKRIAFAPGGTGAYTSTFGSPGPGRWQVSVRATKDGRELARARRVRRTAGRLRRCARSRTARRWRRCVLAAAVRRPATPHGRAVRHAPAVRNRTASARLWSRCGCSRSWSDAQRRVGLAAARAAVSNAPGNLAETRLQRAPARALDWVAASC